MQRQGMKSARDAVFLCFCLSRQSVSIAVLFILLHHPDAPTHTDSRNRYKPQRIVTIYF